ncbi:MAG: hypothetical protein LBT44_02575 [Clostridiales bacterium]|jgi:urease accessory protein|nr:hypothetical protein [Clostridiales bacterium]
MNNFLPLFQAFDALFPIGAYTLSNGMETYTQKGIVRCGDTLLDFLKAQVYLLPYNDLGLAAKAADGVDLVQLDNLCSAMKQPREIRTGSEKLCTRFLKAQSALSDYPSLTAYRKAISEGVCDGHYPVAAGLFIRDLHAATSTAIELYCYHILSAFVNQAVKLVPLGQLYGQSALFEAMKLIPEAARKALSVSMDELGASGCGFDLRAMQHEVMSGRLYMS